MNGIVHISGGWELPLVDHYLTAARVPDSVPDAEFGLWSLFRQKCVTAFDRYFAGSGTITTLAQLTEATMHTPPGHVVMEDSRNELRKHLPIWLEARGRVLVTGLGLGCVVRGLLANDAVTHVDVVELQPEIIRLVGPSLADPRVAIHEGDALEFPVDPRGWDYAWHDISTPDDDGLQVLHMQLMRRFWDAIPRGRQGAWDFPRPAKRLYPFVGGKRRPRRLPTRRTA